MPRDSLRPPRTRSDFLTVAVVPALLATPSAALGDSVSSASVAALPTHGDDVLEDHGCFDSLSAWGTVRFYIRGVKPVHKTEHLNAVFGSVTPGDPIFRYHKEPYKTLLSQENRKSLGALVVLYPSLSFANSEFTFSNNLRLNNRHRVAEFRRRQSETKESTSSR